MISEDPTEQRLATLTRRAFSAAVAGDIDDATRLFADDATWIVSEFEIFEGLQAIRDFLAEWLRMFDGYEVQFDEIRQYGDEVVLAAAREEAGVAGASADARMRELAVYVIAWQGETITRVMTYDDIDTARSVAEELARRGERERPDRAATLGRGDDLG